MRAPPLGLSQLATSFIACPRLGIPRAPLPRLASIPLAPPGPNTPNALDLSFSLFPSPQPKLSSNSTSAPRRRAFNVNLVRPEKQAPLRELSTDEVVHA
jgi:hypothetical protein